MTVTPLLPRAAAHHDARTPRGPGRLADRSAAPARRPAGFALFVGLDAVPAGTDVTQVVAGLRALLAQLAPGAEASASMVVAPPGAGRGLDVVRATLGAPVATTGPAAAAGRGVVIDLARRRLVRNGEVVPLTSGEHALLRVLVAHEGRTVGRAQIAAALAAGRRGEQPNERTVDVQVRRLRVKLEPYEDVVRTVRGEGYQFDPQADVAVRPAS